MSFDLLAPHYRWMEFLLAGEKLQRCRTAFLDQVAQARHVLMLGEGHGRFLVECRRRLPVAQITCVDSSKRMLAIAGARLKEAGLSRDRVTFIHADALTWNPSEAMADVIATHFFLDCFRPDQLDLIIAKVARAATPDASWLFADFQESAAGISRLRSRLILKVMYTFFRYATGLPASELTSPDDLILRHGFKLRGRLESEWGLLHSDHWVRTGK